MTFLEFLELTAQRSGLGELLQSNMTVVLTALLLFSMLCCVAGFKLYRVGMCAMTFLGIVLFSFTWLLPAWGKNKCVTVCAVLGVALTGATFFAAKLDAMALGALFTGSLAWMAFENRGMAPWLLWVITIACGLAALLFVHWFPYWGACIFSSLWGSFTAVSLLLGGRARGAQWIIALGLGELGALIQILLFHRQKLFPKIMPDRIRHRLDKRKIRKG